MFCGREFSRRVLVGGLGRWALLIGILLSSAGLLAAAEVRDVQPGATVNIPVLLPLDVLAPGDDTTQLVEQVETAPGVMATDLSTRPFIGGERILRLLTVNLPADMPAGETAVVYTLQGGRRPYRREIALRVLARHDWDLSRVEPAGWLLAGEQARFHYQLRNSGNVAETLELLVRCSPDWPVRLRAPKQLVLPPGTVRDIELTVDVPAVSHMTDLNLVLIAVDASKQRQQVSNSAKALSAPDAARGPARLNVPSTLSLQAVVAEETDGDREGGMMVEVQGSAAWHDRPLQSIRYGIRQPEVDFETWSDADDYVFLEIEHRDFGLRLGDLTYNWDELALDHLHGRGAQLVLKQAKTRQEFTAVTNVDDDEPDESFVGTRLFWTPTEAVEWGIGAGAHRSEIISDIDTTRYFVTTSLRYAIGDDSELRLNQAASFGDAGGAYGAQAEYDTRLFDDTLQLGLRGRYTTDHFSDEHDGSQLLALRLHYRPSDRWALFANATYNTRGYTWRESLDPEYEDDEEDERDRAETLSANLGYRYRFDAGSWRQQLRYSYQMPIDGDAPATSRLGLISNLAYTLTDQVRLNGRLEFGEERRRDDDDIYYRAGLDLAYATGRWTATASADYQYLNSEASYYLRTMIDAQIMTASKLRMELRYYADDDQDRVDATLGYRHRFANGHQLGLNATSRDIGGGDQTYLASMEYTIPFGLPTVRDDKLGLLRGQIRREIRGSAEPVGVGHAIVRLGDQAAITDADGHYVFTHAEPGTHRLTVEPSSIDGQTIMHPDTDREALIVGGMDSTGNILVQVPGTIRVRFILPKLTPMMRATMPQRGDARLSGIRVIFTDSGKHARVASTDRDGVISFDEASSQTWTVQVDPHTLPAGYRLVESSRQVVVEEDQSYELQFTLEPKVQSLEWVEPK